MPLAGFSSMLCFNLWLMWNLLTPASCQSLKGPCRLASQIALCNNCRLSSVPRDLPGNIAELQLNNNSIRTLQHKRLSGYPALRILRCAGNLLDTIESDAFLSTRHLESLSLADNNLSKGYSQTGLALRALTKLRTLDLSGNGLTEEKASFVLENLTSLEYLSLSRNVMLRLDTDIFRDLHQLRELNLERNMLFEIDGAFDHLQKLQRLNLAFNSLPCLVNFQLTQLVELNASHNGIELFTSQQDMRETFHLETLDLSDNKLFFFPFLPTHSHIRNLLLSNNRVSFYEHLLDNSSANWDTTVQFFNLNGNASNVTVKLWDESLYGGISTMDHLDLTGNQVIHLPQGFLSKMPSLSRLKLGTNCMESLDLSSGEFPSSLYELDMSNNRLTTLQGNQSTLHKLSNLTHLYLSLNYLQVLPPRLFSALPNIGTVDLSYNRVCICSLENNTTPEYSDCAVWSNIVSLRRLYLAGCSLKHLPSTAFERTSITHLDLSNNPEIIIQQDALAGLGSTLQYLDLGNTGLHNFDFTPFRYLKSLNISSNYIFKLPGSLLKLDLTLLDLRNNRLTTIPTRQANMIAQRVQTLFIGGNPFNCCLLDWYGTFEAANVINIEDWADVTCHYFTPEAYRVELIDGQVCGSSVRGPIGIYTVFLILIVLLVIGSSVIIYYKGYKKGILLGKIKYCTHTHTHTSIMYK
ncbi:transforming growth factor beta activator LRRC33 [Conger conger]|uniref:transforming growth factor beta activator LRRC33 n=1 Tax=Conger conger TaxID=82655 RepID=UPI002A5A5427|nr:transforming growth factor beta activator LRRC33 [Conger conger]